jgi:hypothetical protein
LDVGVEPWRRKNKKLFDLLLTGIRTMYKSLRASCGRLAAGLGTGWEAGGTSKTDYFL